MSLLIRNLQRVIPLRRAPLRKNLEIAKNCLGVKRFDVGVICINNGKIRQLNKLYRQQDKATDVLSFPFHENLSPGLLPDPLLADEYNLGDIYLGVEFISQQCHERKEDFGSVLTKFVPITVKNVLQPLRPHGHHVSCFVAGIYRNNLKKVTAVHGLCHLLGYTHDEPEDWRKMFEKESEVLMEINRVTGSSLKPLTSDHFD